MLHFHTNVKVNDERPVAVGTFADVSEARTSFLAAAKKDAGVFAALTTSGPLLYSEKVSRRARRTVTRAMWACTAPCKAEAVSA